MKLFNRRLRPLVAGLAAVTVAMAAPGTAHAAPPSNDDFDTATTVSALPFKATENPTEYTKAPDDPASCNNWIVWSTWFRYTPSSDGIVKAVPSGDTRPFVAVYTGDRGSLTQVPGACTSLFTDSSTTFHVKAGTSYHIMLFHQYTGGEAATLDLIPLPPSPNDDITAATEAELPGAYTGNLTQASAEPGEAAPSCDATADQSVWYRYKPDRTRSVSAVARYGWAPSITVYQGTPDALTEVDCLPSDDYRSAVFTATAGQTYYIRVADDAEGAASFDLRILTAPKLDPHVNPYPERPSVYDEVAFDPTSGDPLGRQLVSGELRFGDGTSTPLTGTTIRHRYAADGEYQVEVTGATKDGRTGTGVRTLKVETHDVTLSGFTVPSAASAGQTKPIKVSVANSRYGEKVKVELLRQAEQGHFTHVGALTQWVAASPGGKVEFPFAYTYTAADAVAGKVTFKVVATINDGYPGDSHPEDNELVATTTTVRPARAVGAI